MAMCCRETVGLLSVSRYIELLLSRIRNNPTTNSKNKKVWGKEKGECVWGTTLDEEKKRKVKRKWNFLNLGGNFDLFKQVLWEFYLH